MSTFAIESVTFTVRGQTFTKALDNCTSEMIARAVAHAFKQRVGDAAAGKEGDEATKAIESAFANLNDWMRAQPATRGAALPTEDALLTAEAKLWLKGKGVVGKVRDTVKTVSDAESEIAKVISAALAAKGRPATDAPAVVEKVMAALRATVATRIAGAGAGDDDLL